MYLFIICSIAEFLFSPNCFCEIRPALALVFITLQFSFLLLKLKSVYISRIGRKFPVWTIFSFRSMVVIDFCHCNGKYYMKYGTVSMLASKEANREHLAHTFNKIKVNPDIPTDVCSFIFFQPCMKSLSIKKDSVGVRMNL